LLALARRGKGAWREIKAEIEPSNGAAWGRAADLLFDLRAVAEQRDALADFAPRVAAIRERHSKKQRFPQRIASLTESAPPLIRAA
jgi:hypothetical protein